MSTKRYKVTASVVRWEHSYDGVHWEYCYHGSESTCTCGAGERKRRQSWRHPLFDSWSPELGGIYYGLGIGDMLETPQGQELGQVTGVEPAEHDHACELRELKKQLAEVKQLASRAPIPSPPPPAPTGIVTKVDEKGFEVTFGAPPGKAHDFSNPYLVAHGGHLRCVDCGKPASSGLCVPDAGWRERWEHAISVAMNAQGLQPSPTSQTPRKSRPIARQAHFQQSHVSRNGMAGIWSLRNES